MDEMRYEAPESLDTAIALLAGEDGVGRVLAGGTDLLVQLRAEMIAPDLVVDIKNISEMQAIDTENGGFRIGAAVTGMDLMDHEGFAKAWPGVIDGVKLIGSIQVKGRATIGGNLCNASPAADGVPALLALEAELEIAGRNSIRRLAIPEFILGNRRTALGEGELVTAICIKKRSPAARSSFQKLGARRYLVISIAMVAVVLDVDDSGKINHARVAVGSCSEVAQRLPTLEAALIGGLINDELGMLITSDAFSPLSPIGDIRADANYRMTAAHNLIRRALADLGDSQ